MKPRDRGLSSFFFLGIFASLLVFSTLVGCGAQSSVKVGSAELAAGSARSTNTIGVNGSNGKVTPPQGAETPISDKVAMFPVGSQLVLAAPQSRARLVYPWGGISEITGRGEFTLEERGYFTSDGAFASEYRKTENGFQIRVPQASLGIRGTKIRFKLSKGTGSLFLIEGKVQVIPVKPGSAPFDWEPGQTLLLTLDGITKEKSGPGQKGSGIPSPRPGTGSPGKNPGQAPAQYQDAPLSNPGDIGEGSTGN